MKYSKIITLSALFGVAVSTKLNRQRKLAQLKQGPNAAAPAPPVAAEDGTVPTSWGWNCSWPDEDLHASCTDANGNVGDETACKSKNDACFDGTDDDEVSYWYIDSQGGDDSRHCSGNGAYGWDSASDDQGDSFQCFGFGVFDIQTDENGDEYWVDICAYYDCQGTSENSEDLSSPNPWSASGDFFVVENEGARWQDIWNADNNGVCTGFYDEQYNIEYEACTGSDPVDGPFDTEELQFNDSWYYIDHQEADPEWDSYVCTLDATTTDTTTTGSSSESWDCEEGNDAPDQSVLTDCENGNVYAW